MAAATKRHPELQYEDGMPSMRLTLLIAGALALGFAAHPALADDSPDLAYAKRMFAGLAPKPKGYACFMRRYDAEHMAEHAKQKVTAMKLLITAETVPEDTALQYSFRLGVAFRDRAGDFDSSGDCGHTAAARAPEPNDPVLAAGVDFDCSVDCDGGGISVKLANSDGSLIVKPLDAIRIWKGKVPDEAAATALRAGADDKIFRLDRAQKPDECAGLVTDRKELAALRHK
jgi:hypothetical protein